MSVLPVLVEQRSFETISRPAMKIEVHSDDECLWPLRHRSFFASCWPLSWGTSSEEPRVSAIMVPAIGIESTVLPTKPYARRIAW